jgi:hypothetical protein
VNCNCFFKSFHPLVLQLLVVHMQLSKPVNKNDAKSHHVVTSITTPAAFQLLLN